MQVKVKALSNVAHGRFNITRGQEFEVTKGEAEDLQATGLVQIVNNQQPEQADSAEAKMAEAPTNKMEDAPENKAEASDEDKPAAGKAARKTAGKKAD